MRHEYGSQTVRSYSRSRGAQVIARVRAGVGVELGIRGAVEAPMVGVSRDGLDEPAQQVANPEVAAVVDVDQDRLAGVMATAAPRRAVRSSPRLLCPTTSTLSLSS